MPHELGEPEERDPVCGRKISRDSAHTVIRHKGKDYFLCCQLCQMAFENNPEMFAYLDELQKIREGKCARETN